MLVLVIVDTVAVVLLAGLVAGLLRSHADILRALHALAERRRDPPSTPERPPGAPSAPTAPNHEQADPAPVHLGPPPGRRSTSAHDTSAHDTSPHSTSAHDTSAHDTSAHDMSPHSTSAQDTSAHDIAGVSPDGDALAIPVASADRPTLLAFLSSACTGCEGLWAALAGDRRALPEGVRPVVVTKDPGTETPAQVRRLAPEGLTVVMSSRAWNDYRVPGYPFFVVVDRHRRAGEAVAGDVEQLAELVGRALSDSAPARAAHHAAAP